MLIRSPLRSLLGILAVTALSTVAFLVVGTNSTSAAPECMEIVIACGFTVPATAGGPVANGGTGPFGTGIMLSPGKVAKIVGGPSGSVLLGGGNPPVGPDGGVAPAPSTALVPGAPYGCLAVRVGETSWSCVGSGGFDLSGVGEVQFGVNDDQSGNSYGDNTGSFSLPVQLWRGWVTFEKSIVGDDPGIEFPIVVTCTAPLVPTETVAGEAAGRELLLGPGETMSTRVLTAAGESETFEVWWTEDIIGVRCDWAEDLSTLPAGVSCTSDDAGRRLGFTFDLRLSHQGGGTVTFTNTCTVATIREPNFTG